MSTKSFRLLILLSLLVISLEFMYILRRIELASAEKIPRPVTMKQTEWSFEDDISDIDLSVIAEETTAPEKSKFVRQVEKKVEGKWKLSRRYTSYATEFWAYEGSQQGNISLSDGIFSLSSAGIEFSGEFVVFEPMLLRSVSSHLPNSQEFVLHVMNFASSMALGTTPHVFYWGEVRDERLVLSRLGGHISQTNPPEEVLYFQR